MPYAYRKIRNQDAYKVFNKMSGAIHSNHTTLDNAKKQIRLLSALDKNGKGMESNLYTDAKLEKMSDAQLIALKSKATDPQLWDRIRRIIESRQLPPASTPVSAQPQAPINLFGLVNPQPERPRPPVQELIVRKKPSTPTPPPSKKSKGGKGVKKGKGAGSSKADPVPEISEESKKRIEELKKQIAAIEEGNLKKAEEITKKIAKKRKEDRAKIAKEDPEYEVEGGAIRPPPPSEVKPLPPPPAQVVAQFRAPDGRIIEVTGQHNIDLLRRNPDYQIIQRGGAMDPLITLILAAISAGSLGALYESYMRLRNNQVVPEEVATELERINIPIGSVVPIVNDIYVRMEEGSLPEALAVEIRQAEAAVPSGIPAARAEVVGMGLPVGEIQQFLKNSYQIPPAASIGDFMLDKKLSGRRVQVYKNRNTPQAVVVHRGTQGTKDWATDIYYATGGDPKNTARFKHAAEVQKKAEDKYGANNITTLGHSIGSKIASAVGQNSKEIINLNKAVSPLDAIQKTSEKEINIRTSRDPVSALLPLRNSERTITIPSESLNPLTEHKTDVLGRLPANQIIGKGAGRSKSKVVPVTDEIISDLTDNTPTPRNDISDLSSQSGREVRDNIIADIISQTEPLGISRVLDSLNITENEVTRVFVILRNRGVSRRILESVQMYLNKPTPERDPGIFGRYSEGYGVKSGGKIEREDPPRSIAFRLPGEPLEEAIRRAIAYNERRREMAAAQQEAHVEAVRLSYYTELQNAITDLEEMEELTQRIGDIYLRSVYGAFHRVQLAYTNLVDNGFPINFTQRELDIFFTQQYNRIKGRFSPTSIGVSDKSRILLNRRSDEVLGELERFVLNTRSRRDREEDLFEYTQTPAGYFTETEISRLLGDNSQEPASKKQRGEGIKKVGSLAKIISPPIKKMGNPWVEHIKRFAAKKGINYAQAMKHPDIKKGYKKGGMMGDDEPPRTPPPTAPSARSPTPPNNTNNNQRVIISMNPENPLQLLSTPTRRRNRRQGGVSVIPNIIPASPPQQEPNFLQYPIPPPPPRGVSLFPAQARPPTLSSSSSSASSTPRQDNKRRKTGKGCCMGMRAVAVRGRGMPTIREAAIAEAYNESQLGANGGRGYVSL